MKILPIQIYNTYNFTSNKIKQQQKNALINNASLNSHSELIGKSLISFKSDEFIFDENDMKFINTTAQELRLNTEEYFKFRRAIKLFLQKHKYKTTEDMNTGDAKKDNDIQTQFINTIRQDLDLSKIDADILLYNLLEKFFEYSKDDYNPTVKPYVKDIELFKTVLGKYKITDTQKQIKLFQHISDEAENKKCKTLFDIFSPPQKLSRELINLIQNECGEDKFSDICLDLFEIAKLDEQSRQAILKNKENNEEKYAELYKQIEQEVCNVIKQNFNINTNNENLLKLVKLHREKQAQYSEIAFYIADKYNLPSQAENRIIEILRTYDEHIQYEIFKNKNKPAD